MFLIKTEKYRIKKKKSQNRLSFWFQCPHGQWDTKMKFEIDKLEAE